MRDVYLWTGYAVGAVIVAALIKAAVRRWLDWSDRRSYVPPSTTYTEVWLPPLDDPDGLVEWADPDGVVMWIEAGTEEQQPRSWALDALSDARKDATDTYATLGEFARPVATASAPIWAEIYGRRHVQGLAIA